MKFHSSLSINGQKPLKSNTIRSAIKNQAWKLNKPLQAHIIKSPYTFFKNMHGTTRDVLHALLGLSIRYYEVTPTHTTIAKRLGISVKTVKRSLDELRSMGLVASIYRHMMSCIYVVHEFLFRADVVKQLRYIFTIFALSVSLSPHSFDKLQFANDLHIINKLITNNKQDSLCRNIGAREGGRRAEIGGKNTNLRKRMIIHPLVLEQTDILLSEQEKIQISSFSDGAIRYAFDQFVAKKNTIRSPFKWIIATCRNFNPNRVVFKSKPAQLPSCPITATTVPAFRYIPDVTNTEQLMNKAVHMENQLNSVNLPAGLHDVMQRLMMSVLENDKRRILSNCTKGQRES